MRWLSWTIGALIAAIAVDFALSNNIPVGPITFWPFLTGITLPLYLALFVMLLIGMALGWMMSAWAGWRKRRRAAKKTEP